jgi:hypothetical protein
MTALQVPKAYLDRVFDINTLHCAAAVSLAGIQITSILFASSLIYRFWAAGWWLGSVAATMLGLVMGWEAMIMIRSALDAQLLRGGYCGNCGHVGLEEGIALGDGHQDILYWQCERDVDGADVSF